VITLLLVSAAGGLGAVARFLLDEAVKATTGARYPYGTLLVNVTGSLLLGLVSGLALSHVVPEGWHLILGTGFLGGYTTFSTASFETLRLLQERRWLAAALHGVGMVVLSVLVAAAGLWLGLRA
jgi:CrcB protein